MLKNKMILIIMLCGAVAGTGWAQMAGNPTGTTGARQWTINANGTYFYQGVGSEKVVSNRFLLKSNWGVTDWLDLYIQGGVANLESRVNSLNTTDYRDKYRFAYGGGFSTSYGPGKLKAWASANVLRFRSQGNFIETLLIGSQTYDKRFEMGYDWREFRAFLGSSYSYRRFTFYLAAAGWYLWRLDTKDEYLESGSSSTYMGQVKDTYRSGLWSGLLAGIQMNLPQHYAINIEVLLFNETNVQIMAGISQTGSPPEKHITEL